MVFKARTKREKYLLRKLWQTLDELDDCFWDLMPCTRREEAASDFIQHLRKTFPELNKKLTKKTIWRVTATVENKT